MKTPQQDNNEDLKNKTGFPSPAMEFSDNKLDLNKYLIKRPEATFFIKVSGNGLQHSGINNGDILVIDRGENPRKDSIALCDCEGEFKIIPVRKLNLINNNRNTEYLIWGIVTATIRTLNQQPSLL